MKVDLKGVTRIVFIFKNFVIKIPNFLYCHQHFLQGCYANWSERRYCKMFRGVDDNLYYSLVIPSLFCSWFGLFQIQKKALPLNRHLTEQENLMFRDVCNGDNKKENFGYYKGRIVCLDYV